MKADNAIAIIARVVERDTGFGSQEAAAYARGVGDALQDEYGPTRNNPFSDMSETDVEELAERLARL